MASNVNVLLYDTAVLAEKKNKQKNYTFIIVKAVHIRTALSQHYIRLLLVCVFNKFF